MRAAWTTSSARSSRRTPSDRVSTATSRPNSWRKKCSTSSRGSLMRHWLMRIRSCVAGEFADLDRVPGGTLAGDGHGGVIVGGLDDCEADDDFLGLDVGAVGHKAGLHDAAGMLQPVAAGHDHRAELLHPCVPGLLVCSLSPPTEGWGYPRQGSREEVFRSAEV